MEAIIVIGSMTIGCFVGGARATGPSNKASWYVTGAFLLIITVMHLFLNPNL